MVKLLKETKEIIDNITICKSDSKVSGCLLRKAHYELGIELGKQLSKEENIYNKNVRVMILMRAGLLFGLGICDTLENNGNRVKVLFSGIDNIIDDSSSLLLIVDSVINTGTTVLDLVSELNSDNFRIATNVISEKASIAMKNYIVYASRISKNTYIGSSQKTIINNKGPDTGDRLFDSSFFNN